MLSKLLFATLLVTGLPGIAAEQAITVYKTRTCGCCGKWVEHLKANGFAPEVKEVPTMAAIHKQLGVPDSLVSCHTAVVKGYTIEGHVPAKDIQRLLKQRSKAKGLAVPGMPAGSPGMEGSRRDAYSVVLFQEDGTTSVFQKYTGE
jgi:hypothetical protein